MPASTSLLITVVMVRAFASEASLTVAARVLTPPLTCARSGTIVAEPSPVTRICGCCAFEASSAAAPSEIDTSQSASKPRLTFKTQRCDRVIVREKINIDIVSLDIVSLAFVCFGFLGFVGLLAAHTCADHQ